MPEKIKVNPFPASAHPTNFQSVPLPEDPFQGLIEIANNMAVLEVIAKAKNTLKDKEIDGLYFEERSNENAIMRLLPTKKKIFSKQDCIENITRLTANLTPSLEKQILQQQAGLQNKNLDQLENFYKNQKDIFDRYRKKLINWKEEFKQSLSETPLINVDELLQNLEKGQSRLFFSIKVAYVNNLLTTDIELKDINFKDFFNDSSNEEIERFLSQVLLSKAEPARMYALLRAMLLAIPEKFSILFPALVEKFNSLEQEHVGREAIMNIIEVFPEKREEIVNFFSKRLLKVDYNNKDSRVAAFKLSYDLCTVLPYLDQKKCLGKNFFSSMAKVKGSLTTEEQTQLNQTLLEIQIMHTLAELQEKIEDLKKANAQEKVTQAEKIYTELKTLWQVSDLAAEGVDFGVNWNRYTNIKKVNKEEIQENEENETEEIKNNTLFDQRRKRGRLAQHIVPENGGLFGIRNALFKSAAIPETVQIIHRLRDLGQRYNDEVIVPLQASSVNRP